MAIELLLFLTLACCRTPELARSAFDPEPQGGAPSRRVATAPEVDRIRDLLHETDRRILARATAAVENPTEELRASALAEAIAAFTPDFEAPDFGVKTAAELIERFDGFLETHREVTFGAEVERAERVGDCFVVDVRRTIDAVQCCDGSAIREQTCETVVLKPIAAKLGGSTLKIAAIYEHDAAKAALIDRSRRIYDATAELHFSLKLPEPFVAVPRAPPGAALDKLLLLDPADDAVLELMLYDPTIDQSLGELLYSDISMPSSEFLQTPMPFEKAPPAFVQAMYAEVEFPADPSPTATDASAAPLRLNHQRAIYLTPGRPYHAALVEANPRW
ncbi:MAG: hypothetical protein EXS13_10605 [Planctomycetes bacterium]|nr:hypothetical protein [Planctomycetota bacterium]